MILAQDLQDRPCRQQAVASAAVLPVGLRRMLGRSMAPGRRPLRHALPPVWPACPCLVPCRASQ